MEDFIKYTSLVSNIVTVVASGIAIYLFITKWKSISSIFSLLINYTFQLTLSELKEKLEKLNEYNAKEPENYDNIVNIFNEIVGQIRGNNRLKSYFSEQITTIEKLISNRKNLTEPKKRSIIFEIREKLRDLNMENIHDLVGEKR